MDKEKAKKRIERLKEEINLHRYNYHVLNKISLNEAVLDSLKHELFNLEQKYPELLSPDSPTQRVAGAVADSFTKSKHASPMLSLFDAFSGDDILAWQDRLIRFLKLKDNPQWQYYCELKLDGLALNLKYEESFFVEGASRGDGKIGENITNNIKTIESVPLKLAEVSDQDLKGLGLDVEEVKKIIYNGFLEVRGEAIISKQNFKALNDKYKKESKNILSNSRNAVAGSLRQLDPKVVAERKIDFYAYDIVFYDKNKKINLALSRQKSEALAQLLGFKVIEVNSLCQNLEQVFAFHSYWEKNRDKLDFEIDGVVVKINELKWWDILGVVGKAPRYAMAFKFSAEQGTTIVKDIVWQVGRTGVLTPKAILEPVRLSGAIISRATLHNMDEIRRLDLMKNDTVILERSGDVIPKIISVLKNLRSGNEQKISTPTKCPNCESSLIKAEGEVAYRCTNPRCYAVNLRQIIHFVSKPALDIENLGPKVVEQLLNESLIFDLADIYNLKREDLIVLERFAEKSADNLILAINNRRQINLSRFLFALGIRHLGQESANSLALFLSKSLKKKTFSTSYLLEKIIKFTAEDFARIDDFGPVVSKSVEAFFKDKHNLKVLSKLERFGVLLKLDDYGENVLNSQSFLLSGSLNNLTREQAKAKIRELGGKNMSAVSKDLDYLILGENPGSKYDKAKELGIKILSEDDFLKMIK